MRTLTPRERVRRALSHREVDRVPIDLGGTQNSTMCAGAYAAFSRYLGAANGADVQTRLLSRVFNTVNMDEDVLRRLPVDTRAVYAGPPAQGGARLIDDWTLVDEWGVTYRRPPGGSGQHDPVIHPLADATIDDLERYPWPNVADPSRYVGVAERARDLYESTSYAVCGSSNDTVIFDRAWLLRGMQRFLEDLLINEAFALALLEKVTEVQCKRQEAFLAEAGPYLDVVVIADDMGTQRGPLLRPSHYRRLVKPFHRRYVETVKRHTGARVLVHACGSIAALVDDYIEIGVDALNPMQVAAADMAPADLKRRFAGRMAFWGGIDTQHLLPHGTPEEVRAGVRSMLDTMGRDGGYVLAAVHNVQDDVPPENVWAMLEAGN
jgi:uroporphyrinogen decarboxylase